MERKLLLLLLSALCLAALGGVAVGATNTHAKLTISAPGNAGRRARVSFKVVGTYSVVANGAERLTIFVAPPGPACPKTVRAPHGADRLLSREPVDRVAIANVLSDRLESAGTWTICAYLARGSTITARAHAQVSIG